jgi:hypothetical protein
MRRLVFAVVIALFAAGPAPAQDTTSCEAKAIDKNGKPMQGAVKQKFLKKCKTEACLPKAVDKNGKPMQGAVKDTFMKKCEAEA